jgi:hypothetical protein
MCIRPRDVVFYILINIVTFDSILHDNVAEVNMCWFFHLYTEWFYSCQKTYYYIDNSVLQEYYQLPAL